MARRAGRVRAGVAGWAQKEPGCAQAGRVPPGRARRLAECHRDVRVGWPSAAGTCAQDCGRGRPSVAGQWPGSGGLGWLWLCLGGAGQSEWDLDCRLQRLEGQGAAGLGGACGGLQWRAAARGGREEKFFFEFSIQKLNLQNSYAPNQPTTDVEFSKNDSKFLTHLIRPFIHTSIKSYIQSFKNIMMIQLCNNAHNHMYKHTTTML